MSSRPTCSTRASSRTGFKVTEKPCLKKTKQGGEKKKKEKERKKKRKRKKKGSIVVWCGFNHTVTVISRL